MKRVFVIFLHVGNKTKHETFLDKKEGLFWHKCSKMQKDRIILFCLWRSPDLGMVSVVVVVVIVVVVVVVLLLLLLVGATFVLSDLCTIQKNL